MIARTPSFDRSNEPNQEMNINETNQETTTSASASFGRSKESSQEMNVNETNQETTTIETNQETTSASFDRSNESSHETNSYGRGYAVRGYAKSGRGWGSCSEHFCHIFDALVSFLQTFNLIFSIYD
jgi:hypothetical protein